jgi:7,8-dihydropterin-6-yl-methyl-4-(beta-D-ribofuranosyl)aminobenzene 5'-phosphate synthase
MKITMLVDNHTIIDAYYLGEPAVSYFIEESGHKYLFDTGYSDVFLQNALAMNISFDDLSGVILSHGHNDHTGGLTYLSKQKSKGMLAKPSLIAHPEVFLKRHENGAAIGCPITKSVLEEHFSFNLSRNPLWLTDRLVFLGEIERTNDFEAKTPLGTFRKDSKNIPDYVLDDSALVYHAENGLVIVTGCSHAGICNIIEQAKKVCKEERVINVIGGFHLLNTEPERMQKTCDYFRKLKTTEVYAAHCIDLNAKIALSTVTLVKEAGVGIKLYYA